jgi:phosphatidate cytidylyltransferase
MNWSSPVTHHLLMAVFGVLITASLIGFILKRRARSDEARATVANLNSRTNSWWIMVIILLTALSVGHLGATLIFAGISFLALREFLTLTPTRSADHLGLFVSIFIVLPFQYWLVHTAWYGMFAVMVPVYAFVLIPMLATLAGDVTDFLERSARTQWALMVCVYFISHIPMLLTLNVEPLRMGPAGLVLFLVTVTQGSDVFQYVWGKLCGKRPIVPKLSPKKTVEGFVGGVLTASALGACMFRLTPFTPVQAALVALVLCVMGFFGGLVMSAIKRARGVKDWGTLIEGHGGMMDRIDSLCFSAPVYFHLLRYFFVRD